MPSRLSYAAIIVLVVSFGMRVDAASWWAVDKPWYVGAKGQRINTIVVTVDIKDTKLRIVSVPFELGARPGGLAETSLRDLAESLNARPGYQRGEWIAVNGAFSSYREDVPLGLLVVDGKVYSTLSKERAKGSGSSGSAFGQLRWSGILCERRKDGDWDVIPAIRYEPGLCQQALQAGPVLVEPGAVVGVASTEPSSGAPYKRTAICLTRDGKMRMVVVLEATYLFPLAQWLGKSEREGGLGCRVALNLSGDTSSGVAIRAGGSGLTVFGEGSFPIATALIFGAR